MTQSGTVADIINERQIHEIVHFTTNLGFLGCLAKGAVLPRNRLRNDELLEHILTLNAPFRAEEEDWFDRTQNWIDFVNLSISEISVNLFKHSALKWHAGKDIFWVIMSFDPALMIDPGVYFSTTNSIYEHTIRTVGGSGLESLFSPAVRRKGTWKAVRGNRPPYLPTCEQAEVLYPAGLPMDYLRKVYVRTGDEQDNVHCALGTYGRKDVEVVVNLEKFYGAPN